MQLKFSPIDKITFKKHDFFIKRDDLLHPAFSGNKARKLYYFLEHEFPDINKLISYGSAQSNALYSLSVLAELKHWSFDYYVDHIPSYLSKNPRGNYRAALANGATIKLLQRSYQWESIQQTIQRCILPGHSQTLFIPEGAHCPQAEHGVRQLAQEIIQWSEKKHITQLNIFLPSGTGTTALYLQKNCPFRVLTCACVGDSQYLRQQFLQLCSNRSQHPMILSGEKKFHFGKLYKEFYELWLELKNETGIEFELLYDPLGWINLLNYLKISQDRTPLLYIHQGGLLGNQTMLTRYKRKYQ